MGIAASRIPLKTDHLAFSSQGYLHALQSKFDQALSSFKRALQVASHAEPLSPEPHRNVGEAFAQVDRWSEGLSCLETCVKLYARKQSLPLEYIDSIENLGKAYLKVRRYDKALEVLTHANTIRQTPDVQRIINWQVSQQMEQKPHQKAG